MITGLLVALCLGEVAFAQDEADSEDTEATQESAAPTNVVRSGRMEFDARLVKGETAKSGAVYLFKREPRALPPLVPLRRSFRSRIVEPILGDRELAPVTSTSTTEDTESKAGQ